MCYSPDAVCTLSHHIKVATSMAVAVARKRPDMWVRTVRVLLEILEREIKTKVMKEETVGGGKDGGVEPTIVQSLLKLVSKKYLFDIFVITSSQSIAIVVDTLKVNSVLSWN